MKPSVVLLNPPSRGLHIRDLYCSVTSKGNYYWPPIDLLVVSGWLKDRFRLSVIDAPAEGLGGAEAMSRIRAAAPAALVSLAGSATWPEDAAFLKGVKEAFACRIAVTGDVCVDPSSWPLEECPWIDGLITDFTAEGLADFLESGAPAPGVAFRRAGRAVRPPPAASADFSFPVPAHGLFPLRAYRLPYVRDYPFSSVLTNFGCPFKCSYCIQNRDVMGHRSRRPENVREELDALAASGVRELYFRDPLFESRPDRAKRLCRELKGYRFGWSCNSRVSTMTEELAALMKEAGCRCVAFGLETADEGLLKKYEKPVTVEQARKAIAACKRQGLLVAGYFILGLPGEGLEGALRTIRFSADCGVDYASFSVASPDYGTSLRADALRRGKIPADFHAFNRSRVGRTLSDELDERQLAGLLRQAVFSFYARPARVLKTLLGIRGWRQAREVLRAGFSIAGNYV